MEQAFERALRFKAGCLPIVYADSADESKIQLRFSLFLQKQRTTHILVLAGEAVLVPISGLVAFLPGPNIAFYALALLMITQWLALRGINRTIKTEHEFIPDPLLGRVGGSRPRRRNRALSGGPGLHRETRTISRTSGRFCISRGLNYRDALIDNGHFLSYC